MALSSADRTIIRLPHHTWTGDLLTINAVPLNIVATAQINASSFSYPVASLAVDNTSANWLTEGLKDRLVLVGTAPGTYDVAAGVLRADVTANTILLDPKYAGMTTWPLDIAQELANDYYISIVKLKPAQGVGSSIRKGIFYKNWDTAYSDQNKNPTNIIRLGEHQQADVDPTSGVARFTIDVDPYLWAGRSYSSHAWNADSQTVISSDASQLVVDCEPGCHEISYEHTDSKGKVTLVYRYLFANDDAVFPALSDQYDIDLDCTQDRQGCIFQATIKGTVADDAIFPGQLWLMTTTPRWGNPQSNTYYSASDLSDPSGVVDNFVAYVADGSIRTGRGRLETELTLESPVKTARAVRIEKQVLIESSIPQNWAEATSLLTNPVGMFYYLSALHAPYLINGHDFQFDTYLLNLRRKIYNLDSDVTLGGQLEQLARALDGEGNIGSDASGTTWMLRHPAYLSSAARTALSTQFDWQADDIEGDLERPLRFRPQVGKTYAGAFAHNGGAESEAYRSLAPGYVASHAPGELTMDDTTVTVAGGQVRVNEIAGFHHARQNTRSGPFQFAVKGIMDVAEPCRLDLWHTFTVAASYDPLGDGWTNARFLPQQVTRRWAGAGERRFECSVEAEPESFGYPGITLPTNPGAGGTWVTTQIPVGFEPYQEKIPQLGLDIAVMTAWNSYLLYGRSFNFGNVHTSWAGIPSASQPTYWTVIDATLNWHSAYFSDPNDPLEALVLVFDNDTGTMYLYSIDDLLASAPTITLVESWSDSLLVDQYQYNGRVLVSQDEADFWIVAWNNSRGVLLDRSTDGGSTWDGFAYIGDDTPGEGNDSAPLGIAVDHQRQIVIARDGSEDSNGDKVYFVYTASTKAGAFSKITNPTDWQVIQSCLALRSDNAALVPMKKLEAPTPADELEAVTFDAGTFGGTVSTDNVGSSAFYPAQANMAYDDLPVGSKGVINAVNTTVTVFLDAYYTFSSVTFWRAYLSGWTVTGREGSYIVALLDDNDNVIASRSFEDAESLGGQSFTVTAADLGLNGDERAYKVRVTIQQQWTGNGAGASSWFAFLDDIDITATLIDFDSQRTVYQLDPSTGTYTERNTGQRVPFQTYGIAVDSQSGANVSMICADENGDGVSLLNSSNGGANWTRVRSVEGLVGLKRSGNTLLMHGYNRLEASIDTGEISYNLIGDWAARVGPVNLIRGIAGVL